MIKLKIVQALLKFVGTVKIAGEIVGSGGFWEAPGRARACGSIWSGIRLGTTRPNRQLQVLA